MHDKLNKQKQILKDLISQAIDGMPLMIKSLIMSYRSSVFQLVDNLTEEQMQSVVDKAKQIVALVECEE